MIALFYNLKYWWDVWYFHDATMAFKIKKKLKVYFLT